MNVMQMFREKLLRQQETLGEKRQPHAEAGKELKELLLQRRCLQSKFDLETDEDRIEVFIYEMEALEAKIRACLRSAKTQQKVLVQEKEEPLAPGVPAPQAV